MTYAEMDADKKGKNESSIVSVLVTHLSWLTSTMWARGLPVTIRVNSSKQLAIKIIATVILAIAKDHC